jgi:lysophospholipase L1-like esterase
MLFYLSEVPSFTKWTDVADYFPDKKIINRGFGGSRLTDLNDFADDLLAPYQPKQIIIYCGENDFADNHQLKAQVVVDRYKAFIKKYVKNFLLLKWITFPSNILRAEK